MRQSPYKHIYLGNYTLMVQLIKEDLEWLDVVSPEKITIEKSLRLGFSTTNNEVKYGSLLVGIAMAQKMRGRAVEVFSDSRLVVGQVKGELEARDLRMQEYLSQVRHLQSSFEYFTLQQIPRSKICMLTLLPPWPPP